MRQATPLTIIRENKETAQQMSIYTHARRTQIATNALSSQLPRKHRRDSFALCILSLFYGNLAHPPTIPFRDRPLTISANLHARDVNFRIKAIQYTAIRYLVAVIESRVFAKPSSAWLVADGWSRAAPACSTFTTPAGSAAHNSLIKP